MPSIRERNGSYQITVSRGYDVNGKKLFETATYTPDPSLTPKKREKAVQDFAQEFERKVRNGLSMSGRKITLKEFTDRWIEEYAKVNLQPGTMTKYQEELQDKILPALGHLKLSDLKPHNINAFLVSFTKDGARKDGKPGGYSKATIAKTRNVLSSILRTATEWEVIDSNPCDKIRHKSIDVTESVKYLTPEQTATFLAYIEEPYTVRIGGHKRVDDTGKPYTVGDYVVTRKIPEQMIVLYNLAVYTGLRKAELLALQWKDVDCSRDQINVVKSVTQVDGKQICKVPKSRKSHRHVSIPHFLTERLLALKAARNELIQALGDYWKGDDWIFIQDDGKMMNYSTPYHALQDTIARYNLGKAEEDQLPMISFHGLRHTSATILIAEKQDIKTVSSRLGHAQTSTTMNIYAHALQESDRVAANTLEEKLKKKPQ